MVSVTNLGTELKSRRGSRSLSEISRESGVSVATLSRIEAGLIKMPSRETLTAVSIAYGMPLEALAQLVYTGS